MADWLGTAQLLPGLPVATVAAWILAIVALVFAVAWQHSRRRGRELQRHSAALAAELETRNNELKAAIAELERRLAESVSLQAIGQTMVQELHLPTTLHTIARESVRVTGGDSAFVTLLTPDGQHQFIRAIAGDNMEGLLDVELDMETTLAGQVARSRQPQVSNDALRDPRLAHWVVRKAGWTSIVEAPIKIKDRVLGVLGVGSCTGKRFGEEDVRLVTLIGNQAAIAIENARLYEAAREVAVFEERTRLARELHDSISQSLFSIVLNSEAAGETLQRPATPETIEQSRFLLGRVQEIAQEALGEMRSLIFELRPASLREKGLAFALQNHISLFRRRHGIEVDLSLDGELDLGPEAELALYRVAQEALTNVAKHAGAARTSVRLAAGPKGVFLTVHDDGQGFAPASTEGASPTFGLTGMRERLAMVGGTLAIESRPGCGTKVQAWIPRPAEEAAAARPNSGQ